MKNSYKALPTDINLSRTHILNEYEIGPILKKKHHLQQPSNKVVHAAK